MAQCPNCHAKLHFWNVKAECPHCHANIPNHNWEQRLDADAEAREDAFYKMHTTLAKLKYAVIGTPLHLIRLICCVLPLLGYLLPMAHVIGKDAEIHEIILRDSELQGENAVEIGASQEYGVFNCQIDHITTDGNGVVIGDGSGLPAKRFFNLTATDLKAGKELQKVNHPNEGAFSDFDNLTDPAVGGF